MKFKESVGVALDAAGVKYFASCLDELLYEYTPATYKPRVMSVRSLVLESISVIDRVVAGVMDRVRLYPILDELKVRLQDDLVARSLLSFPVDYYTSYTKDEELKSIKIRLGLLLNGLAGGRYRVAVQHEVVRVCQSDREKSSIRNAAKNWVSAVEGIGFSRQYIRLKVDEGFFSGAVKFETSSDLGRFFEVFDEDRKQYEVFFVASSVISDLSDVIDKFKSEIIEPEDPIVVDLAAVNLEPGLGERLVVVRGVLARDVYSARNVGDRRLEHISDLFALFHHKNRIKWSQLAAVRVIGGSIISVSAKTSSVQRARDNLPKKASQKLALKIGELSFSDQDSAGRFVSVVRLHGAAQEAASSQAQIVNLWTAMEVLVSKETDSKLRGVKRCITPFLVYGYIDRILYALAGDLYRWKRNQISRILKRSGLSNWPQHQKLAAVLLGGALEPVRNDLYALVDGFPLLRNRVFYVSELISDVEKIGKSVKDHEQRVLWQIERIYRARNSIVHDGSAPRQVDVLTENAHEYLDAFIDRFLILCSEQKLVATLDEAIAYQTKIYDDWRKALAADKAKKVSVDDVRLFCALDSRQRGG